MDPRDGGPDAAPTTVNPAGPAAAGAPRASTPAPDVDRDAEPTRFNPARQSALAGAGQWTPLEPGPEPGALGGVDLRHHDDPDGDATSVIDRSPVSDDLDGDPTDIRHPGGDVEHDEDDSYDPDAEPTSLIAVPTRRRGRDWNWVEEWRSDGDQPAWAPGVAVGIFVAAIVAVALIVLTSGLVDNPLLAVVINVVIAAGMAPALWLSRSLPVLRFLAGGAAAGLVIGWIWMLATFPGAG